MGITVAVLLAMLVANFSAEQAGSPPVARAPVRIDYEPSIAPNGRGLAFISNRDGTLRLWIADLDGSNPQRVSSSEQEDDTPAWSPNGRLLAFTSLEDGHSRIFLIDANGSGRRRLTSGSGAHLHPNWSPDGRRILFNSFVSDRFELREIDVATGAERILTSCQCSFASWSRDEARILLRVEFDGNSDIAVMGRDGRILTRVTADPAFDGWPSWSAQEQCVTFAREQGVGGRSDIFVMASDGTLVRRLTSGPGRKTTPRFTPDGRSIIYARGENGGFRLVRIAAPGDCRSSARST